MSPEKMIGPSFTAAAAKLCEAFLTVSKTAKHDRASLFLFALNR